MAMFDLFSKDIKKRRMQKATEAKRTREECQRMLFDAEVEIEAKHVEAKQLSLLSIRKCRQAELQKNHTDLQISRAQLRAHYAMFVYSKALLNNIKILKANLDMHQLTTSFARVVQGISALRIPQGSVDFKKLTSEALKNLVPADLQTGADTMLRTIIEGSLQAQDVAGGSAVSDAFLDALIQDEQLLEQDSYAAEMPEQQVAQADAEAVKAEELSFNQLLEKLSAGLE